MFGTSYINHPNLMTYHIGVLNVSQMKPMVSDGLVPDDPFAPYLKQ
jgi:hypothetical protein